MKLLQLSSYQIIKLLNFITCFTFLMGNAWSANNVSISTTVLTLALPVVQHVGAPPSGGAQQPEGSFNLTLKLGMLEFRASNTSLNTPSMSPAILSLITVTLLGNAQPGDVARIHLYKDDGNNTFSYIADTLLRSATFGSDRLATLGDLTTAFATLAVGANNVRFFLAISLVSPAASGKTIGVQALSLVHDGGGTLFSAQVATGEEQIIGGDHAWNGDSYPDGARAALEFNGSTLLVGQAGVSTISPAGEREVYRVFVGGAATLTWTSLILTYTGDHTVGDVDSVRLYSTTSANRGQRNGATFVASTLWSANGRATLAFSQPILPITRAWYLVTLSMKSNASSEGSVSVSAIGPVFSVPSWVFYSQPSRSYIVQAPVTLTVSAAVVAPASLVQFPTEAGAGEVRTALLRLTLKTGGGTAQWKGLNGLSLIGDVVSPTQLTLYLYRGDAAWHVDDPVMQTLAIPSSRKVSFTNLAEWMSTTPSVYVLAVGVSGQQVVLPDATIGLTIASLAQFSLAESADSVSADNFPLGTGPTTTLVYRPGMFVTLTARDVAPATVVQAQPRPVLLLTLVASPGRSTVFNQLSLHMDAKEGGGVNDYTYKLWRDQDHNALWDSQIDTLVKDGEKVGSSSRIRFGPMSETITATPTMYFITVHHTSTVPIGSSVRVTFEAGIETLGNHFWFIQPGATPFSNVRTAGYTLAPSAGPIGSSWMTVEDAPDTLTLSMADYSRVAGGLEGAKGMIRQGAVKALVRLTFNTPSDWTVLMTMKVRATGTLSPEQLSLYLYGDTSTNKGSWQIDQDTLLAVTHFSSDGMAILTNLALTMSLTTLTHMFLAVEINPNAEIGPTSTVGLSIDLNDPSAVGVGPPDLVVRTVASWQGSLLLTVVAGDTDIYDFPAAYDNLPEGVGGFGLSAVMKLTAVVWNANTLADTLAVWNRLEGVLFTGTDVGDVLDPGTLVGLRLYRDADGNGLLEEGVDSLVGVDPLAAFSLRSRAVSGFSETLGASKAMYFLAVTLSGAAANQTVGVSLLGLSLLAPDLVRAFGTTDPAITVKVDDPDTLTMGAAYVTPIRLTQGGTATFMKVTLTPSAPLGGAEETTTTRLVVSLLGTLPPSHATVTFARDGNHSDIYEDDDVDPPASQGGAIFSTGRLATLMVGLRFPLLAAQTPPYVYFLRLSLNATAEENATVGLTITGPGALKVLAPDTVVYTGTTVDPGQEVTARVEDKPDAVTLVGTSDFSPSSGYLRQGESAAFLRLRLKTASDRAILNALRFAIIGDLQVSDLASVKLYRDELLLGTTTSFTNGLGTFSGLAVTLTTSNATLSIVAEAAGTAEMNKTVGIAVWDQTYFTLAGVDTFSAWGGASTKNVTLVAGDADFVTISKGPDVSIGDFPRNVLKTVLRLTLRSAPFDARVTALRVSLNAPASVLPHLTAVLFRDEWPVISSDDPTVDLTLATATFGSDRWGTFTGFSETVGFWEKIWYVALRAGEGVPEAGMQLTLTSEDNPLTVADPDRVIPVVPMASPSLWIPWNAQVTLAVGAVAPLVDLTQTRPRAFLRLTLSAARGGIVTWAGLTVLLTGDLPPGDLVWGAGQGGIYKGADGLADRVDSSPEVSGRQVTFSGLSQLLRDEIFSLGATTLVYQMVLSSRSSAVPGLSVGVAVTGAGALTYGQSNNFPVASLPGATTFPLVSATAIVRALPQIRVDAATPINPPMNLTQTLRETFLYLTLKSLGDAVSWTDLSLSLTGDLPSSSLSFGAGNTSGLYRENGEKITASTLWSDRTVKLYNFNETLTTDSKVYQVALYVSNSIPVGPFIGVMITGAAAVNAGASTPSVGGSFPVGTPLAEIQKVTDVDLRSNWTSPAQYSLHGFLRRGGARRVAAHVGIEGLTAAGLPITLNALSLSMATDADPTKIHAVLYRETGVDSGWSPLTDESLAFANIDAGGRAAFTGLTLSMIPDGGRSFYVALEADAEASLGATLKIVGSSTSRPGVTVFTLPAVERTAGSDVSTNLPTLTLAAAEMEEVFLFGQGLPGAVSVSPGGEAPLLRLSFFNPVDDHGDDAAVLGQLLFSLRGNLDSAWASLRLYKDGGNGTWEGDQDTLVTRTFSFNADRWGTFQELAGLPGSTLGVGVHSNYFITVSLAPGAPLNDKTIGVRLMPSFQGPGGLALSPPDILFSELSLASYQFASGAILTLGSNQVAGGLGLAPIDSGLMNVGPIRVTLFEAVASNPFLIQGPSGPETLLRFRLRTFLHTASFSRLKVSLTGNASASSGVWQLFEGIEGASGSAALRPISTGFVDSDRTVTFIGFNAVRGTATNSDQFAVRFSSSASVSLGTLIGVTLLNDPSWFTFDAQSALAPFQGFGTTLLAIRDAQDTVTSLGAQAQAPPQMTSGVPRAFLKLSPVMNQEEARWVGLFVTLAGTLNPTLVTAFLYKEFTGDGEWNIGDTSLSSMTFSFDGKAFLSNFNETLSLSSSSYFVVLSLASSAPTGRTVGVKIGSSSFELMSPDIVETGLSVSSGLSSVESGGTVVGVEGLNLAPSGMWISSLRPLYRLSLQMVSGLSATLSAVRVSLTGSLNPDVFTLYLYRDDGPGDGAWTPSDTPVGTLAGRAAFGLSLAASFAGLTDSLGTSPTSYFLVLSMAAGAAIPGAGVGVTLVDPLTLDSPAEALPFAGGPTVVQVDSPDQLDVSGVVLPVTSIPQRVFEADSDTEVVQLTLVVSQGGVFWKALRVSLTGTLNPALVNRIRLVNNVQSTNQYTATFGADRWATLTIDPPLGRELFPLATWTYSLQLRVPFNAPPGATVGLVIPSSGAFSVSDPDTVTLAPAGLTFSPAPVADYPDYLSLVGAGVAPSFMLPGDARAFYALTFTLEEKTIPANSQQGTPAYDVKQYDAVVLDSIKVTLTGTVDSSLVTARLYRDANANGAWEVTDTNLSTVTFAADPWGTFTGIFLTLSPANPKYFIALSASPDAPEGGTIGVYVKKDFFQVLSPDQLSPADNFTGTPAPIRLGTPPVSTSPRLTASGSNLDFPVLLAGTTVPLLRLSLQPGRSGMVLTRLELSLMGTLPPDEVGVKIYRDDGNGQWDGTEEWVGTAPRIEGTRRVAWINAKQTLSGPVTYFLVGAHAGDVMNQPIGFTLWSELLTVSPPDQVEPGFALGTPLIEVKRRAEAKADFIGLGPLITMTQGDPPQPALTFSLVTDQDQAVWRGFALTLIPSVAGSGLRVDLYRDNDDGAWSILNDQSLTGAVFGPNGVATLAGFHVTLTTVPQRFFVTVTPSTVSPVGAFLLTLGTGGWNLSLFDVVQETSAGVGLTIVDVTDTLTLASANGGPATHRRNAERVYLQLTLSMNHDSAVVTSLKVQAWGTVDSIHWRTARWFADTNANGAWEPAQDALLASAPFQEGGAVLAPTGFILSGPPLTTFVTVRLGRDAPENESAGLSLAANPIGVGGVDAVDAFLGFVSGQKQVVPGAPLTLAVSSGNPGHAVFQGTVGVTLLQLTLSMDSAPGDVSEITGLTFRVDRLGAVNALWMESNGATLASAVEAAGGWSVAMAPPVELIGTPEWRLRADVPLLAPPGFLRVTLVGVFMSAPDVVRPFEGNQVGSLTVNNLPDTIGVGGMEGPGTYVARGFPPSALLALTARLTNAFPESAILDTIRLSLMGAPPVGVYDPSYFTISWYRDNGDSLFSADQDARGATVPVPAFRQVTLTLTHTLVGSIEQRFFVAVGLSSNAPSAYYGGTVGLSVVGAEGVGLDPVVLSPLFAVSLRPVLDQWVHVQQGLSTPPSPASSTLVRGEEQAMYFITLTTDRDTAELQAVVLSNASSYGEDGDFSRLALYRGATPFTLAVGTFVNGLVTLTLSPPGTVSLSSSALKVAVTVNPFAEFSRRLAVDARLVFPNSVVSSQDALTGATFRVADHPDVLTVGASDLSVPVAITGEAFQTLRISLLPAGSAGVGVTQVGVRLIALNAAAFAPHLAYYLYEGSTLLATGGLQSTSTVALQITFGMTAPVFSSVRFWDVVLVPGSQSPSEPFRLQFEPADVRVFGTVDGVTGTGRLSETARVVSSWGSATVQMTASPPLVGEGHIVARESATPVARILLNTKEAEGIARLTEFRVRRVGRGTPNDVRIAVYTSPESVAVFDASVASRIGEGVFQDRLAAVTLSSKPFLTNRARAFWFVAEVQPTALVGATWGMELGIWSFLGQGLVAVISNDLPFRTPSLTIQDARSSQVSAVWASPVRLTLLQGSVGITLGTFTLRATAGNGATVTGLRVSLLTGDASLARLRVLNALGQRVDGGWGREPGALVLTLREPAAPVSSTFRLIGDLAMTAPPGASLRVAVGPNDLLGLAQDTRTVNGGNGWVSPSFPIQDAPDQLTLAAHPRPVPWEVSEWTPAFLMTLSVNQDEASLIRITLGLLGNWLTGELDNFRMRIGNMIIPAVTQSLGSGLIQLSLVNYPVTKLSSYPVGALELSLSPSITLTSTLGLSLLGVGVAADPVTGAVVDTVTFDPTGTSLLGIRHPRQPFPPDLVIQTRYLKGVNALSATWTALVKQGALTRYRYAVLQWTGDTLDFTTLSQSLTTEPPGLPTGWTGITPWMVTTEPRVVQEGVQLAHGMTLYIAVQAQGEDAPWSEVVYSQSILVDSRRPAFLPAPPGVVKGKKQMVLSWTAPDAGPSGVERYVVERRRGTKPAWEVLVSAQAPRLEPVSTSGEEWRVWYPSSYAHLVTGESGNLGIGKAPAISKLSNYQITKLLNAPLESKLVPFLSATSAALPLEDGTSYYRVKAVSGAGEESEPTAATKVVAGIENLPGVINEVSNYPNPFDSRKETTTLVYILNQDASVKIRVYTLLGVLVKEWAFASGALGGQAGANEVTWDGTNGQGEKITTGMYICLITADVPGGARVIRKIGVEH